MFVFAASVQCVHHYDWHTNTDDVSSQPSYTDRCRSCLLSESSIILAYNPSYCRSTTLSQLSWIETSARFSYLPKWTPWNATSHESKKRSQREFISTLQQGNLFHPTVLDLRGTPVFINNISSHDSLEGESVHLRLPRFSEGRMKAK
jgi:hypothetical protein